MTVLDLTAHLFQLAAGLDGKPERGERIRHIQGQLDPVLVLLQILPADLYIQQCHVEFLRLCGRGSDCGGSLRRRGSGSHCCRRGAAAGNGDGNIAAALDAAGIAAGI